MRRPFLTYGAALAALVVAVLLRWVLDPLMGDTLPLVTLFGAVAVAVGSVLVFRDMTQRKQAERALRESEARLRMALSVARSVAWEHDPETGRLAFSDIAVDVLGLAPGSTLEHVDQGFALLHPDDVERHRAIVSKAVEECGTYLSQYRILRQDTGELRWMEERGNGIRERPGEPVRLVGVVTDITDRKQTEEQLRRSAELLTFLIDRSPTGFYIVDADFRISHVNADSQARAFRNVSPAVGRRLDEAMRILWPEPLATEIIQIFRHTLETGEPYRSPGLVSPRNDLDAVETYEWQLDRISLPDGRYGVVCYYYDTTLLREAEQQLRESEAQLRASAEHLKEADRRKDEFLATLAHELRNPLAPISNALSALKLATHDPASLEQARSMMERQLGQMVRLVDDLLDVSRISRDRLQLRLGRVELASIIYQAVETCRPQAESSHLELAVTLPSQPVYLEGDPVRLAQVFSNLLNNSCKFTRPGGSIRLAAEREGSDVVVAVRDDGVGIPPDKLESVFEMFVQVDNSLERSHGGLGLGLTLVKRIVELHGGRIEARSEGPGLGSEFVVRLPLVVEKSQPPPPEASGEAPAATSRRRILVVDDNRDSADTLAKLLELTGNETHVAYDGQQAIDAAGKLRPEVILLDIGLPRLNGYDACRAIRGLSWGGSVVVIALSGWGQDEDKRKSTEAGFDGHLVKPVDQKALMKLLASLWPARR